MRKWKCTVCGYIHTGEEPPEKCPVCGADRSKFVEVTETEAPEKDSAVNPDAAEPQAAENALPPSQNGIYDTVTNLMVKHHAHPISAHIPNGVLPVSVLFILIAGIFDFYNLGQAALYNMMFVLLTMPFVLFSGYNEWKRKYGGNLTPLFMTKMASAAVVTILAVVLVVWGIVNPHVFSAQGPHRWTYMLLGLVMVGAAGIAGFIGGKLVFKD